MTKSGIEVDKLAKNMKSLQILNGSTLKWVAIITMLIDHIGAAILEFIPTLENAATWNIQKVNQWDNAFRSIGRTAFPIFAFLLVEGFCHTSSRLKYVRNLVILAIISEIPFDLAFFGYNYAGHQNIFFTLAIGILTLWLMEWVENDIMTFVPSFRFIMRIVCLFVGCFLAEVMNTDYGAIGILLIGILYLLRERRFFAAGVGALEFAYSKWAFPAFILMLFYNGKRGHQLKYFFYLFYPAHLIILYFIRSVFLMGKLW